MIWGSAISGPFNFNLGTGADDDAIKYAIYAKQVAEIVSMVSNVHLQVFCAHGEFYVPKPDSNALTPGTFSIEPQSRRAELNNSELNQLNKSCLSYWPRPRPRPKPAQRKFGIT